MKPFHAGTKGFSFLLQVVRRAKGPSGELARDGA
jgi:hypothetical protein